MSLRKSKHAKPSIAGLSLLQGLFVLALIGVIVAVVATHFTHAI